mmetsp:Transcript_2675/g.8074  ORF Transcript_2675/g.8074 Transcript_2675/m.8074 type:complete len:193 (-) Transcript_2675:1006-1584(-)|eukprot:CAMPEP_0198724766 /NCGR_PEP_ID=MMETSP1475-20131203/2187_1 /TAXON_ID= ORGANISM="Unidentified sp., Strain CCMP1999" /NCGR_SAMPLE_ID=MMETSP1475 /ASSEMBLY_ACC=CAM_ASM_001111 /LENGTH=192 /DNA_ID=CAMNT_0044486379 /DNA_START=280 /DNA_END=858 /DNA_ORIENTATION=-
MPDLDVSFEASPFEASLRQLHTSSQVPLRAEAEPISEGKKKKLRGLVSKLLPKLKRMENFDSDSEEDADANAKHSPRMALFLKKQGAAERQAGADSSNLYETVAKKLSNTRVMSDRELDFEDPPSEDKSGLKSLKKMLSLRKEDGKTVLNRSGSKSSQDGLDTKNNGSKTTRTELETVDSYMAFTKSRLISF